MNERRILLVEDDPNTRQFLAAQFRQEGWSVSTAQDGQEAMLAIAEGNPDLVVLDYSLPGENGVSICERLRSYSLAPIIFLSATSTPDVKVRALLRGADDYVTKPCHLGELMARVRAVLRGRADGIDRPPSVVEIGRLQINAGQRTVTAAGCDLALTRIEFDLLLELARHPGEVLPYSQVMRAVWGTTEGDTRVVHVHICNLRRKLSAVDLGGTSIRSVAGVGYILEAASPLALDA